MFQRIILIVLTAFMVLGMVLAAVIGRFTDDSKKEDSEDTDHED